MQSPFILSVDDNIDSQELVKRSLSEHYHVHPAYTVNEAVQVIHDQVPALILMDIHLPDGNGYEASQVIRQRCHQKPHIIFLSALNSVEDRLEAYRCGATDYLAKPIEPAELKAKIELSLQQAHQLNALSEQAQLASDTAMTAMINSGEQGQLLNYTLNTFNCESLNALAQETCLLLQNFRLDAVMRFEALPEAQYFSTNGVILPLEGQLLLNASHQQKIISKGNRTLFNDQQSTLLIKNMPIEDEALYGRLKDHLALVCKTLNARINTLNLEHQTQAQRQHLASHAIQHIKHEIQQLDANVLQIEAKLRHLLDELLMYYEEELLAMGLTVEQEARLLQPLTHTKEQLSDVFDITEDLEKNTMAIEQAILQLVKPC